MENSIGCQEIVAIVLGLSIFILKPSVIKIIDSKKSLFEPEYKKFGPCMSRQIQVHDVVGVIQGENSEILL